MTVEAGQGDDHPVNKVPPEKTEPSRHPVAGIMQTSAHDTPHTRKMAIRVLFRPTAAIQKIAPCRLSCGTTAVGARASSAGSSATPFTYPKGALAKSDAAVVIVGRGPDWDPNIAKPISVYPAKIGLGSVKPMVLKDGPWSSSRCACNQWPATRAMVNKHHAIGRKSSPTSRPVQKCLAHAKETTSD